MTNYVELSKSKSGTALLLIYHYISCIIINIIMVNIQSYQHQEIRPNGIWNTKIRSIEKTLQTTTDSY